MYHNIPLELRQLRQWVCWRYEIVNGRKTKVPYCPSAHNPQRTSIHNPATWGTFNDAVSQASGPTMDGIGLVLTEDDPYTGIDIDDKQENPANESELIAQHRILEAFQSYTERSVGARWRDEHGRERGGYHIIIRGKINGGRDRGHVGVYSTARYLTFSGEVVRNAPIAEYQELLTNLIAEMPHREYHGELDEVEGHLTDAELHEMALNAANGSKYAKLCAGPLVYGDVKAGADYPSGSEADLALISMLAYYTRDNAQVRRMFRYTHLGKRQKHQDSDNWINRALRFLRSKGPSEEVIASARLLADALRVADEQPAEAPSSAQEPAPALPAPTPAPAPAEPATPAPARAPGAYNPPPGLIGDLARFFHATAVRPLEEAALCGAIGLVAGIAGRSYNISGTGLNQYILFLGKTGTGKEGIAKGISKMMAHTRPQVSMVDDFIGPSAFASGQGLIRVLDQKPCFVSLLGEFGLTLQALSDPRAPAPVTILRKVLLDLYSKSGWEDVLQSTAYSDIEKNTKTVHAPNVTILAESTPETFYDGIDVSDISDGLIPRFHVVEYTGKRGPRNKQAGSPPPQELVQRFADLCGAALTSANNNTCAQVQLDPKAQAMLDDFDVQCDRYLNESINSGEAQLYNRAHLKSLKLAGLLAVGCNPHAPVVTEELARWAIDFTQRGTEQILARFTKGDVGSSDSKQMQDVRRAVEGYFKLDKVGFKSYQIKPEIHAAGFVTYRYLVTRLVRLGAFAHERTGAVRAVKSVLDNMVSMEVLGELNAEQAEKRFGVRQSLYFLGSGW